MRLAGRRNGKHGLTFPFAGRNRTPERKTPRKRAMAETIRNVVQTALVLVVGVAAMATYNLTTRMDGLYLAIGELHGEIGEMRGDIRRLESDMELLKRDVDLLKRDVAEIKVRLGRTDGELRKLNERVSAAETDPAMLLRRHGVEVSERFVAAVIKGDFFVFPRTEEAIDALTSRGWTRAEITPVIAGYHKP